MNEKMSTECHLEISLLILMIILRYFKRNVYTQGQGVQYEVVYMYKREGSVGAGRFGCHFPLSCSTTLST